MPCRPNNRVAAAGLQAAEAHCEVSKPMTVFQRPRGLGLKQLQSRKDHAHPAACRATGEALAFPMGQGRQRAHGRGNVSTKCHARHNEFVERIRRPLALCIKVHLDDRGSRQAVCIALGTHSECPQGHDDQSRPHSTNSMASPSRFPWTTKFWVTSNDAPSKGVSSVTWICICAPWRNALN